MEGSNNAALHCKFNCIYWHDIFFFNFYSHFLEFYAIVIPWLQGILLIYAYTPKPLEGFCWYIHPNPSYSPQSPDVYISKILPSYCVGHIYHSAYSPDKWKNYRPLTPLLLYSRIWWLIVVSMLSANSRHSVIMHAKNFDCGIWLDINFTVGSVS